jgi:spermidine synthase
VDFFKEVKNILKEGGLVAFKVTSSENYINADLKKFLQSLYITVKVVFEDVKVIPGDSAIFLAATQKDMLTYDYRTFEQRAKERNLALQFVRDYYLFSKLSQQRTDYIEKILKENSSAALNYDFRPSTYLYATIFWLSYFRDSFFNALLKAVNVGLIWIIFLIILFFIFLFGLRLRHNKSAKNIIALAVLVMGFSSMSLQLIILLSFQFIYGYLFYSLGFLLTAFMAGLALGAFFVTKFAAWLKNGIKTFIYAQTAIFIYCLLLPLFLKYLNVLNGPVQARLGADILFPLASVIVGAIGGIQFPLANKIYLKDAGELGKTAGLLYGLDLLGACLGAFLVSIFLVPLIGIVGTCCLLGALNFSIFLILVIGDKNG